MEEFTRVETEERDYFTTIPNMLFDLPLTHTAFKLYCWYRKVCSNRTDNGSCWMSLDTITERCRMDRRTVLSARAQLLDHDLIRVKKQKTRNGSVQVVITLTSIWGRNHEHCTTQNNNLVNNDTLNDTTTELTPVQYKTTTGPSTKQQLGQVQNNNANNNTIKKNKEENKQSRVSKRDLDSSDLSSSNLEEGFFTAKDKPDKPDLDKDTERAKKLYNAVKDKGKYASRNDLRKWSSQFRLLRTQDAADDDLVDKVLDWYCTADWTEKYMPAAWSASAFREKFAKLFSAMDRATRFRQEDDEPEEKTWRNWLWDGKIVGVYCVESDRHLNLEQAKDEGIEVQRVGGPQGPGRYGY